MSNENEIIERLGALVGQVGEMARSVEGLTKAITANVTHPMRYPTDWQPLAEPLQSGVNFDGTPYRESVTAPIENSGSVAGTILAALKDIPDGLTQTQISGIFSHNLNRFHLGAALKILLDARLVEREKVHPSGSGKPTTWWRVPVTTTTIDLPIEDSDSEKAEEAIRGGIKVVVNHYANTEPVDDAAVHQIAKQIQSAVTVPKIPWGGTKTTKKRLRIGICIIGYNVAKELDWLIESLTSDHHDIVIYLYRHSKREQFPEVAEVCDRAAEKYKYVTSRQDGKDKELYLYDIEENRGLSWSWNEALISGFTSFDCDFVLLINDDIQFNSCAGVKDLDRVADFVMKQPPDVGMVTVLGWHDHYAKYPHLMEQPWKGFGYSCFAITRSGWEAVGCFDTNFRPIYFEDCDHGRRMWLANLRLTEVKNTGIIHWGSMSNAADAELRVQHGRSNPRNELYYSKKWGGGPGQEAFKTPFDDASYGLYLSPEKHTRPYGPVYDRYDFAEVIKR